MLMRCDGSTSVEEEPAGASDHEAEEQSAHNCPDERSCCEHTTKQFLFDWIRVNSAVQKYEI